MAAVTIGGIEIELRDYDKESTSITFFSQSVAAADWVTAQPLFSAVKIALGNLTTGAVNSEKYMPLINGNQPAIRSLDTNSMREIKWRLIFRDLTTLDEVTMRIGTADPTNGHLIVGSKKADMTDAEWVALHDALEAFEVINPATGNLMELVDAEIFGWND